MGIKDFLPMNHLIWKHRLVWSVSDNMDKSLKLLIKTSQKRLFLSMFPDYSYGMFLESTLHGHINPYVLMSAVSYEEQAVFAKYYTL